MNNLVSAGFSRLFKGKIFYIALVFCIVFALLCSLPGYTDYLKYGQIAGITDGQQNIFFVYFGFVSSIFISIFIGREFSDNTIRNKLIAGYRRTEIYLSNLIVCIGAELIILTAFNVVINTFNLTLLGGYNTPWIDTLKSQLIGFLIILVYSAIFTMISMLVDARARKIAVSIILAIVLYIFGNSINQSVLSFNTYIDISDEIINDDGPILTPEEAIKYYQEKVEPFRGKELSGIQRSVFLVLDDMLPSCQAMRLNDCGDYRSDKMITLTYTDIKTGEEVSDEVNSFEWVNIFPTHAAIYVIYDIGMIVVFTALGLFIFNKKDLK